MQNVNAVCHCSILKITDAVALPSEGSVRNSSKFCFIVNSSLHVVFNNSWKAVLYEIAVLCVRVRARVRGSSSNVKILFSLFPKKTISMSLSETSVQKLQLKI